MKHLYIISIVLLLFQHGCIRKNQQILSQSNTIAVNYHQAQETINDYEIIDSIQYIKLEDTDDVMGEIKKLVVTENEYLLLDNQRKWIWIFEKNGKYRTKIAHFGKGPQEYSSIINFSFSKSDQINILSNAEKCIVKFNTRGEFLGKFYLDYYPADYFSSYPAQYVFYYYIPHNIFNHCNRFYLNLLDRNYEIKKGFFPYRNSILSVDDDFFLSNGNEYYFHMPFNDTIYQIKNEKILTSYVFDFGKDHFPAEEIKNASNLSELDHILKRKFFQGNVRNILISDDFISLRYSYQKGNTGQVAFVLYDLKTNRLRNYKSILKVKEKILIDYPVATDGKYFYNITYPYYFPNELLKANSLLGSNNVTDKSNPVILRIKYKHEN